MILFMKARAILATRPSIKKTTIVVLGLAALSFCYAFFTLA